jgi:hypothetical protein
VGLLLGFQHAIHPFLAVTDLAEADVLVVDGWTPTYTLKQAADEFRRGGYRHAIVLKGIYEGLDHYESGQHSADYVAELLAQYGVPRDRLHTVFCSVTRRDRTYHSAVAAREWLAGRGESPKAINVATVGPHARRSRLLYEKAFAGKTSIGVLALQDRTYDPAHWWRSSEGVREVISESAAYLYVRCFFHP